MEYIFIVNNAAGNKKIKERIEKDLEKYESKIPFKIYITKCPKDATNYVKEYCTKNNIEETCFVACGGDGTINEVSSALVGQTNKYLGILAFGSGNDFIKYYENKDFTSIDKLLSGTAEKIDIIKVNESYAINMCNVGFEAMVGSVANKVKEKGGKHSYTKGIIKAVFSARYNDIDIYADGEKLTKGKILLASLANCKYAGGKYKCAPKAINNDGLIDVCIFHSMSLIRFLSCIKIYTRGEHLEYKKIENKRVYRQAKNIKIESKKPIEIVLDGETLSSTNFDISILQKEINLIIPSN